MNPNDEIRRLVLQYFYDRYANATSIKGKKGAAATISTIRAELKALHGLKQQQVVSALLYLMDNGWVTEQQVNKTVVTRTGGHIPQTTPWYMITAKGIDRIEGGSQFEPKEKFAGININATGQNVITLGDGNVVNAEFRDLHTALGDLKEAIAASKSLSEQEKLDAAADVETLREQLAKAKPNKGVVAAIWQGLERIATASGVATAYEQVAGLLEPLLS